MSDYYGLYPAFVSDNKDPEHRGRVRCISPEVFGDEETPTGWCEPVLPLSKDWYVPPVGEGVYIAFEQGDVDSPVYFGSWFADGEAPDGVDFEKPHKKRYTAFENLRYVAEKDKESFTIYDDKTKLDCLTIVKKKDSYTLQVLKQGVMKAEFKVTQSQITAKIGEGQPELEISDDHVTINGKLTVTKEVDFKKSLKVANDANISGISFLGHTHTGAHGETSTPH